MLSFLPWPLLVRENLLRFHLSLAILSLSVALYCDACSSGSSSGGSGNTLSLNLSSSMVLASQDGTPGQISLTVSGTTAASTISTSTLPTGVTAQITQPGASGSGALLLIASSAAAPGSYTITAIAAAGSQTSTQSFTLVVAVSAVVSNTTDTTLGINGKLLQFMSTSFQPAGYDYQFFQKHANEPAQLQTLGAQHIRLQEIAEGIPWKTNSNPPQATDWDFTVLDAIVQPVLSIGDHSPEFQIAVAPHFPGLVDGNGHLIVNSANLQIFANYSGNLVRYYNKGGFDWGGKHFQSASSHPITWWGIFNEYNINGLTPAQYTQLYNAVVPAMLAIDPAIKLSALELSDYDYQIGDPRNNLPVFFAAPTAGGVNAQVNVASTHFYSTCNQTNTDTTLFSVIPQFVSDVQYFRQQLATRPDLGNVAVWVTENNVNADFTDASGNSVCNPGQKFVSDPHGTSAFFAAWRPYIFSQLGKAGNQALYHWDYDADPQYGETDYTSGNKYLSFWVDYTLGKMFPVTPNSAPAFLSLNATDSSSVELLATKNPDSSYIIMVANRAVHSPSDNNGTGDPRTLIIDVSALGNFSSISQITLQSNTDIVNGPQPASLTPAPKLTVTLPGYGSVFLQLKP
jgi:hypothetical protein